MRLWGRRFDAGADKSHNHQKPFYTHVREISPGMNTDTPNNAGNDEDFLWITTNIRNERSKKCDCFWRLSQWLSELKCFSASCHSTQKLKFHDVKNEHKQTTIPTPYIHRINEEKNIGLSMVIICLCSFLITWDFQFWVKWRLALKHFSSHYSEHRLTWTRTVNTHKHSLTHTWFICIWISD